MTGGKTPVIPFKPLSIGKALVYRESLFLFVDDEGAGDGAVQSDIHSRNKFSCARIGSDIAFAAFLERLFSPTSQCSAVVQEVSMELFPQAIGNRRLIHLIPCITAIVLISAATALAAPPKGSKVHKTRTTHTPASAQPPTVRTPGLPFDRVIRPGLERELAKVAPALKTRNRAAAITSKTSSLPNFGGFLAAPKYQAFDVADQDTNPLSVFASGDFNKDGKPDLVTVQVSGTVNVLLNQGGGVFGSPISTIPETSYVGGAIQAIGIDLNKDGYDDLVLLDGVNNSVDVLLNNGDGTFGTPKFFNPTTNLVASIAVGDMNGDGFPDIVLYSSNVTFYPDGTFSTTFELDTLLNDGAGGLLLPPSGSPLSLIITLPDSYDSPVGRSVVLADVNGDGILDATVETLHYLDNPTATADSEHIIVTSLGMGGGVFTMPNFANDVVIPSLSTANVGYPLVANLNVVDINHDGIKDIVFSHQDYNIWAALGNGDGTYQYYYNVGAYQAYPTDLMVADFNGNGFPALIDAEPGYLGIYPNRGDGTFDTTIIPYYGSGIGEFSVLSIADFTGDGTPDVALMNYDEDSVTIFAGVPANPPAVHAGNLLNPQMGDVGRVVAQAVLDANNDGNDDIVLYNAGAIFDYPGLLTALGDGKGNFAYINALPGYQPTIDDFIDQAKGDFNGDGLDDLVLHTPEGVSLLLSNGDGTFTRNPISLPSFSCITGYAAIGDLNGDGKLDLVIAYGGDLAYPGCNSGTTPSGVFVLLGNGDGTFQQAKYVAVGEEVYEPVLLDTNNDGKLDLIVSDVVFNLLAQAIPATFDTFLLLGNGDGSFQPPTDLLPNVINAHTMTGDINGDGKTDLMILTQGTADSQGYDPTTAGVLPMLGSGNGTFSAQPLFLPGFFSATGLLTDINGDGKLDLVLNQYTSFNFTDPVVGGVAALGNGDGTFTPVANYEGGYVPTLILHGDFLKNGAPDTVYVSAQSGSSLLLNQGGTSVAATADPTSIEQGQSVAITATVKASIAGRPQPTGTITLMEGTTNLGSGTLSGGTATISVSGLAVGTHTITAVYSGDGNFNVNSSATVSVQVTPPPPAPAVNISASTSSLSLTRGQTGTVTFTALANATYSGNISFAVTGAPSGMSVSFAPSQVALTPGQSATAVLVVSTTAPKSELQWPLAAGGGVSLAGLLLLAIPRRLRRKLSSLTLAVFGAVALTAVLGLTGCGGGNGVQTAPKGTTTLSVTATPTGLSAQTISVTVTVQ
jgi:hypothetical protein